MLSSSKGLLRAQTHAATVLGATLGLPGTTALRRTSPLVTDTSLAGIATTVVRPAPARPSPGLVFVNGATPDGRAHPTVLRLGVALARCGYTVLIPDLPGIARGELSPETLAAAVTFTHAAREQAGGRLALAGVSVGATLALLTAADAGLADDVSVVACVAPYTDLSKVMLLATTGMYRDGGRLEPYPVPAYLGVGLARSLAALLPPTPAATALCAELRALDPSGPDPLGSFRQRSFAELGGDAASLFALLVNRDAQRFDELYAALPEAVRATVESLSPVHVAGRLLAPVEIVTAPRDKYFPVAESEALVRAAPHARLTVTSLLAHATPSLSPRGLVEVGRLNGFFVRSLAAASS
jgi:pimeloyl-ACP methyl ester carboxylesterase